MTIIDEQLEAMASLQSLIDATEPRPAKKGMTTAQRKTAHEVAISDTDIDHLLSLDEKFRSAIDVITANQIDLDNLGLLTPEQLVGLMQEALNEKDLKEVLEVRYKMIKAAIFAHLDEVLAGQGINRGSPGDVAVPQLGKKFARQGGRVKAKLDEAALAEALGPERWAAVNKTTVVPEHVETHLDEDALLELVAEDPALLEVFRDCVISGGVTPVSFHVRNMER